MARPGPDQSRPTSRRVAWPGPSAAGGVAVAGEGVAHEHGVAAVGGEGAPGLVGDLDAAAEQAAALERERPVAGEGEEPAPADRVARAATRR